MVFRGLDYGSKPELHGTPVLPATRRVVMKKSRKVSPKDISRSESVHPHPEPLLITIPASAQLMGTTIWAMRELLWSKKIPHIKIGKRFLIDPADLRAFVASQKQSAA
jgi:hypothetical protein